MVADLEFGSLPFGELKPDRCKARMHSKKRIAQSATRLVEVWL